MRSPETLAEVLQLIEADLNLSPTRRRDIASALRAIGKIAHQDLAAMPASFAHLRTLTAPHTAPALATATTAKTVAWTRHAASFCTAAGCPKRGRGSRSGASWKRGLALG